MSHSIKALVKVAAIMATALPALAQQPEWLHETPEYQEDGEVEIEFKGRTLQFEHHSTSTDVTQRRSRDQRVVIKKKIEDDPWSLNWEDNSVR